MKYTKRLLSLILTLALCLAMTACASEEDKAFEAADALLAAGDYEGAIAAFSAIGRYQEISNKIAEAEKLRNEANMGFLFGKWIDMEGIASLTLKQDGTGILTMGTEVYNTNYTYANNTVTISQPLVIELKVEQQNGITHLIWELDNWDFISEADYATAGPVEIELTMDNWEEYFELRRADWVFFNAFKEPNSRCPGYGIFLRDEYLDKYIHVSENEISFEIQFDEGFYIPHGDWLGGDYELEPTTSRWETPESGLTQSATVWDFRDYPDAPPDFDGTISASINPWGYGKEYSDYIELMDNAQVIRVQGTLKLKR